LLARRGAPELGASRVLCPGAMTTAHFLYRTFHPGQGHVEQVVFSDVIPRLERGEADYGVCIHEGRFTYARHGLTLVEDLGATWEHASLDCARADPNAAFATMRAHARELEPSVIWAHVDLYVNEWTRDLGPTGSTALRVFEERARAAGLMAHDAPALCVRDSG
jgi:1,4-dihydroxy-6-naphthoate synthase